MRKSFAVAVAAAMLGLSASGWAQQRKADSAIDPNALAALERMGAFLRSQPTIAVRVDTETDEVLQSGQKIQFSGTSTLNARRPDRLRAEVISDRKHRQFFYDGKTFTLYSPRLGYYATVPAPPRIRDLADSISKRYGVELPLADLFYWGTNRSGIDQIREAIDVGPSRIDGVETEHYAFRQPELDWQIWIERGPKPLPRKLLLTTIKEPSQPQHVMKMSWDLKPLQSERSFSFVPPKGAKKIEFLEVSK
jgi:hypothetical protein